MDFYFQRFIFGLIAIFIGVVTCALEPFIGLYYAGFSAIVVGMIIFIILPTLRDIFRAKRDGAAVNKDDLIILIIAMIGIIVVGFACWSKVAWV